MAYADVFQMPVELDLKFVTIVRANSIDPEWEFGNDVIHEVNCILLRMPFINLQRTDACRIINGRVLKVPYLATFLSFKIKEFSHRPARGAPAPAFHSGWPQLTFCAAGQAGRFRPWRFNTLYTPPEEILMP